ncbi:hypothetical protein [Dyella sp. 20L07]|uniref:hypothetical protein n=1 Tax=Dyella sp. 20L07 TaxID=3384240 RepID=UPI003D290E8C
MNMPSHETRAAASPSDPKDIDQATETPPFHGSHLDAYSIVFFSAWVSVCCVAPEFIWQGLLTVIHHFSWVTVGDVFLVGAVVAFFVEPLAERLRAMRLHLAHKHRSPAHATFAAFGFAVLAVCVHEAITSFVSTSYADNRAESSLFVALSDVFQWSSIPFLVTVAWLCARRSQWLHWATLLLASGMVFSLGFISDWSIRDTFTTMIPCACILFAGLTVMRRHPTQLALSRCIRRTAIIAAIWLVTAGLVQLMLALIAPKAWYVYTWMEYTIDFRFYVGWVIGLAVAPRPVAHH